MNERKDGQKERKGRGRGGEGREKERKKRGMFTLTLVTWEELKKYLGSWRGTRKIVLELSIRVAACCNKQTK